MLPGKEVEATVEIARRLGVKLVDQSPSQHGCNWSGKVLAGHQNSQNIIHDLAHWMVAPPSRRRVCEFGLGSSPDVFSKDAVDLVSTKFGQREEEHASLLGIIIERDLGHNWRYTWRYHSWKAHDKLVHKRIAWLIRNGLITTDLKPTFSTRRVPTKVSDEEVDRVGTLLLDDYERLPF